jgi:uncharacterized protein (DUF2345 family)
VEDINAHLTRLDGVEMLDKLRREGRLAETLQLAVPLADAAGGEHSVPTDKFMQQQRQQQQQQQEHGGGKTAATAASAGSQVAGMGSAAA